MRANFQGYKKLQIQLGNILAQWKAGCFDGKHDS